MKITGRSRFLKELAFAPIWGQEGHLQAEIQGKDGGM